eukprot:12412623-Karenia_brevis.AAC.1
MRWQMDLVDLRYSPSRGNKNMLVLVNVYTRKKPTPCQFEAKLQMSLLLLCAPCSTGLAAVPSS